MKNLDVKLLNQLMKLAGDQLKGEWLLVGGTLLPAVGLHVRSTVDIDLVGLGDKEAAQGLELMRLAASLDLSVETIHSAAAFYVREADVQKRDLLPLHKGKNATIFRPTLEFYWKLKLARLSEGDLLDCQHYLQYCKGQGDKISSENLRRLVSNGLKAKPTPEKAVRLRELQGVIQD